ncbi:RND transporter [Amycolatopsis sp. K13G38]|uniref:RND transporter n=1 Tax=Amycolatopsis acididurans TaxID=2724524 RepID=A0ABX1J380_9PSEU|nr:RND transporter [Amycolatopsis acididurans]
MLLAVAGATVGGLLRFQVNTKIESFLPANDPSLTAVEDKARSFGGDPIVVLLETPQPRQTLLDQDQLGRLLAVEGKLSRLPDVAAVYGPATVLNQIAISAQDLIAQIAGRRDAVRAQAEQAARAAGLPATTVTARGDQAVAAFDLRYGSLLVQGLPTGLPTLHNPRFVENVIYDSTGAPRPEWHFVVPSQNSIAVLVRPRENLDQEHTSHLVSAVRSTVADAKLTADRTTITGIPAITAGVADQVAKEAPLLAGLTALAMILRLVLVPARVSRPRRLIPLAASLAGSALTLALFGWLGVSMSFGAVALLPLLLGIGSSFPIYLQSLAGRRRVLVTALASAVAFGSLAVSPLPFVRELGLALAVGVVMTVLVALALHRSRSHEPPENAPLDQVALRPRVRWPLLVLAAAVAAAGWIGLAGASIQADPRDLAQGLPSLEDAQHAEAVLGSSGEVNVVLQGADVLSPQALAWSREAENAVTAKFGADVRPVLTPARLLSFLGAAPTTDEISAGLRVLPTYITSAVIRPDGQESLMTFGVKIGDVGQQARLLSDLRAALPPPPPGLRTDVAGLPVAANRAYTLLSDDRYLANLAGIGAAAVVLFAGLRRRGDAARGSLAAVLATGWTLAGITVAGLSLTPLTLALGSLITVTACEFTVLLANAHGRPGRRVIAWACVTSAIGYLALLPSSLALLRDFGLVLAIGVAASYLAAKAVLILLPARRPAAEPLMTAATVRKEIYS